MGIDVDIELSASLQEQVSYLGTLLKSFPMGEVAAKKLLQMIFGRKRIERLTERIGAERLEQAQEEVDAFQKLTLMQKVKGPEGVSAPTCAAVMLDGGRYQQVEKNTDNDQTGKGNIDKGYIENSCTDQGCIANDDAAQSVNDDLSRAAKPTHWHEYKAGICLELEGRRDGLEAGKDAVDPSPEVPDFLLNVAYVDKLTSEIGKKAAAVQASGESLEDIDCGGHPGGELTAPETTPEVPEITPEVLPIDLAHVKNLEDLEERLSTAVEQQAASAASAEEVRKRTPLSPKVKSRDVVATIEKGHDIGRQLAARAWHLGMFQSERKAFVGDGSSWIWTIFTREFKPFGFTPILDIIHAVTYVYAAAMAGRTRVDGAPIYQQWVRWLWQGELSPLIAAVAARQAELGLPAPGASKTSPQYIVTRTLTYLQNQQGKMRQAEYRKLGLPITSSHMESTIKELNYRIKGSEKFWSEPGGAAVLQLNADTLCESDPLAEFWKLRPSTRTGLRSNTRPKKSPKKPATAV